MKKELRGTGKPTAHNKKESLMIDKQKYQNQINEANKYKYKFEEVNKSLDPYFVVKAIGQSKPEKHGDELRIKCPIHHSDNQASLCININKKEFYCHGCNAKGDLIGLYAQVHNIKNYQALEELAGNNLRKHEHYIPILNVKASDYTKEEVLNSWNNAKETGDDHYFKFKKLPVPPGVVRFGKNPKGWKSTMVMIQDIDGNFAGLVCVGKKKFNYKVVDSLNGCFTLLGEFKEDGEVFLGEGIATVQTAWEAKQKIIPAVASHGAGNLLPVATAIKEKYPKLIFGRIFS